MSGDKNNNDGNLYFSTDKFYALKSYMPAKRNALKNCKVVFKSGINEINAPISNIEFDAFGNTSRKTTIFPDNSGIVTLFKYDVSGNKICEIKIRYDKEKNITCMVAMGLEYDEDGILDNVTVIRKKYNESGKEIKMKNFAIAN